MPLKKRMTESAGSPPDPAREAGAREGDAPHLSELRGLRRPADSEEIKKIALWGVALATLLLIVSTIVGIAGNLN